MIETEVVWYQDERQADYEDRMMFWEEHLPALPSHNTWFEWKIFERIVGEMVRCEIDYETVDRLLKAEPGNRYYDKKLIMIDARLNTRRKILGLTASKINSLMPKQRVRVSLAEKFV